MAPEKRKNPLLISYLTNLISVFCVQALRVTPLRWPVQTETTDRTMTTFRWINLLHKRRWTTNSRKMFHFSLRQCFLCACELLMCYWDTPQAGVVCGMRPWETGQRVTISVCSVSWCSPFCFRESYTCVNACGSKPELHWLFCSVINAWIFTELILSRLLYIVSAERSPSRAEFPSPRGNRW